MIALIASTASILWLGAGLSWLLIVSGRSHGPAAPQGTLRFTLCFAVWVTFAGAALDVIFMFGGSPVATLLFFILGIACFQRAAYIRREARQ